MFHQPFNTQSERIHVLTRLRQDEVPESKGSRLPTPLTEQKEEADNWINEAKARFPDDFSSYVPESAQRLILWCLEKNPSKRPSAKELLQSDLVPRKIELERTYLQEALQIISNPQSESYGKILNSFFSQATPQQIELMFDTDACARADIATNSYKTEHHTKPHNDITSAFEALGSARANVELVKSLTMSPVAIHAATSTLNLSQGISKTVRSGKEGELLRGVPQCAAIAVAMSAATTAAITGGYNADPHVVQFVCDNLRR
jgi:serine/threonine protein kinase